MLFHVIQPPKTMVITPQYTSVPFSNPRLKLLKTKKVEIQQAEMSSPEAEKHKKSIVAITVR